MTKGQKIKYLLNQCGMSRTDFAAKIGASKQTVYKYENDIVTNIPSDMIERICHVFNVSPGYLMGWEEKHEGTAASCSPDSSGSVPEGALIVSDPNEVEVIEAYRKKDLSGRNMIRGALGLPMLGESSTSGSAGPADLRDEVNIA
jgi:transcriptional regulator with XRE-family HTH domain